MRYIRYAILAVIALSLITVALANRTSVTLNLLPIELSMLTGRVYSIDLPLYLVVFGSIIVGLLLGFVWEWLREGKYRSEAVRERREKDRLSREVERMKKKAADAQGEDDVLALLEDGR